MKRLLFYILLISISPVVKSQALPDSLKHYYDTATSSDSKRNILKNYSAKINKSSIEQVKLFLSFLSYFTKINDKEGIANTKLLIGTLASINADFETSLKYHFAAADFFQNIKDSIGLLNSYMGIAIVYVNSKNNEQALSYWKRSILLAKNLEGGYYAFILNGISDNYNKMNRPDSALPYAQEAVRVGYKIKDTTNLDSYLGTMGEVYISMGQFEIARSFINQSIYWSKLINDQYILAYDLIDLSKTFLNTTDFDSSVFYARRTLRYTADDFPIITMQAYELLYKAFEKQNKADSSNKYFRLSIQIKDSLLSDEKNKSIQTLSFQEQIHEKEKEAENEEIARQHKDNIENVLIALGIISFTILFFVFSRHVIANEKLIKFLGILALLLVFEFTNLLLHSFLEEITHHSQIVMLLLLVSLAAILIPLHHKIEKWTLHKIIERNKELRLLVARKVIAELEKSNEESVN